MRDGRESEIKRNSTGTGERRERREGNSTRIGERADREEKERFLIEAKII